MPFCILLLTTTNATAAAMLLMRWFLVSGFRFMVFLYFLSFITSNVFAMPITVAANISISLPTLNLSLSSLLGILGASDIGAITIRPAAFLFSLFWY